MFCANILDQNGTITNSFPLSVLLRFLDCFTPSLLCLHCRYPIELTQGPSTHRSNHPCTSSHSSFVYLLCQCVVRLTSIVSIFQVCLANFIDAVLYCCVQQFRVSTSRCRCNLWRQLEGGFGDHCRSSRRSTGAPWSSLLVPHHRASL